MCPLLPNRLFILPERQTGRQTDTWKDSLTLLSFQLFSSPPSQMTPLKLTCTSKMLIKQTHFSSTAKANKRASTSPFKSEWQCNTTAVNAVFFIQGTSATRYSVENINFRCGGEDGRFVCLCWLGLDMPREPFKPFVKTQFLPLLHLQITFQANNQQHEGTGAPL